MDESSDLGSKRLIGAIARAEVLNLFFPLLRHSLILDTRSDQFVPPAILLDGMVGSAEARRRSFAILRPHFPVPEKLVIAAWPGSTRSLVEAGIYDAILDRWRALGHPEGEADARQALRQLARLERAALRDLISGATSKALWQRER